MTTSIVKPTSARMIAGNQPSTSPESIKNENVQPIKTSWWKQLIRYSAGQQNNRFSWLATSLFLQSCVLAPMVVGAIVYNGNNFALWIPCIAAFALTEIVNLAAMPTKITIPVLLAGAVVDIATIIISFIL